MYLTKVLGIMTFSALFRTEANIEVKRLLFSDYFIQFESKKIYYQQIINITYSLGHRHSLGNQSIFNFAATGLSSANFNTDLGSSFPSKIS